MVPHCVPRLNRRLRLSYFDFRASGFHPFARKCSGTCAHSKKYENKIKFLRLLRLPAEISFSAFFDLPNRSGGKTVQVPNCVDLAATGFRFALVAVRCRAYHHMYRYCDRQNVVTHYNKKVMSRLTITAPRRTASRQQSD